MALTKCKREGENWFEPKPDSLGRICNQQRYCCLGCRPTQQADYMARRADYMARRNAGRKVAGLCRMCGKPVSATNRAWCEPHRLYHNQKQKEYSLQNGTFKDVKSQIAERDQKIIETLKQNPFLTAPQIGAMLNVTEYAVNDAISKRGDIDRMALRREWNERNPRATTPQSQSREEREKRNVEIVEWALAHPTTTLKEIAETLGLGVSIIWKALSAGEIKKGWGRFPSAGATSSDSTAPASAAASQDDTEPRQTPQIV